KLLVNDVEISARAAASALKVIVLELVGKPQLRKRLLWSLAGRKGLAGMLQEQTVEFAIVEKVLPLQRTGCRMAGNDGVDVLDRGYGFGNGCWVRDPAPTIIPVDQRLAPGGENIAGVHRTQLTENDERVAIGVGWTEVIHVDGIRSAEQGHPI